MTSSLRRAQGRGFTLMETAVVLSVAGVAFGAIWTAFSMVQQKHQIEKAIAEMQTVAGGVMAAQQGRSFASSTTSTITSAAIGAGSIPAWAVVNSTTAVTPWGGSFTVQSAADSDASHFRISFAAPPTRGCIGLIAQATQCSASDKLCPLRILAANGGSSHDVDSVSGWSNVDATVAQTWCKLNAAIAGGGSIAFDFAL